MKEAQRLIDQRYALLTLAILRQAAEDARQKQNELLAWEAKNWIIQHGWSLVVLLDLPIAERQYKIWMKEIDTQTKRRNKKPRPLQLLQVTER